MRQRLDRCANQWLHEHHGTPPRGAAPADAGITATAQLAHRPRAPWIIAAACFVLACAGWWPQLVDPDLAAAGAIGQWRAVHARDRLLASTRGVGHWPWAAPAGESLGDVVWDNARQRGFLRLRGFVANDPTRGRYQLWIFDAARDERYPVDGGVFDVPPGRDEVVIPVRPALPVLRPTAFAVTVERPGGAVVSQREKVVAFAHTDR